MFFDSTKYTTDSKDMSDEELLKASLEDPEVFAHLVLRHEKAFIRKARSIVGTEENAEDVVQEAFIKMYLAAPRFVPQEGAGFRSWAYRIVVNTACSLYRKQQKHFNRYARLLPEHYESLGDESIWTETYEEKDYVATLLTHIPKHLSRIVRLRFLEGYSTDEVADREALSPGAVKTRVYRAKAALRHAAQSIQN